MSAPRSVETARAERWVLGGIWVYQGVVPKWFGQLPFEIDIVRRSGWFLVSPEWTLAAVGVLELGLGAWLLAGYRPRLAAAASTACLLVLQTLALRVEPALLLGPFGGIVKNAALLLLAWRIWKGGGAVPGGGGPAPQTPIDRPAESASGST